jgi:vancomycin resistance protein VanJ
MRVRSQRRWSILGVLTLINAVGVALLIALEAWVGERTAWTTLLIYAPQVPLALPTLVLLAVALVRRWWRLAAWNGATLLVVAVLLLGWQVPQCRPAVQGTPLRVVTMNVECWEQGRERVVQALAVEQPDVVFLQEAFVWPDIAKTPDLNSILPGLTSRHSGDVAILSRYPIQHVISHLVPGSYRTILEARIMVQGTPVTLLAPHLLANLAGDALPSQHGSFVSVLAGTAAARATQVDMLLDIAAHAKGLVIIAGDFNTPPRGQSYARLAAHYPSAFTRAGWGCGYTYPTELPLIRIDHIFTDPRIGVTRCAVVRTQASDHQGLVAELVIPTPDQ